MTGAAADPQRVVHRVGRDVAEIDEHAEPVHLAHHFLAELRQPVALRRRRSPQSAHGTLSLWVSVM